MIKYLILGLAAIAGGALAAPPAEHFFEAEHYKDAKISPSGRYLALRVGDSNSRDRLMVFDNATLTAIGGARMAEYDIDDIRWVNDERLVFTVVDHSVGPGDRRFAPGLYGINRDGKQLRQLVAHHFHEQSSIGTNIKTRMEPWNTYLLPGEGGQNSEVVYVQRVIWPERPATTLNAST